MNKDDIQETIRRNLERKGIVADEPIRVMPDPYSGMRIAVISDGFEGMRRDERKQIVLEGLSDVEIAWIDLLTSAERPWAGPLPGDVEPDKLPLWPESLARVKTAVDDAQFPSDLDEDPPLPIVATFYSFDDWLSSPNQATSDRWTESAIKEVTEFISYQEALASSDSTFEDRDVWKAYRPLADWISKLIPMASEKRIPARVADLKNDVLKELTFSTGTAEQQENILVTFVETSHVRKAMRPEIPLVIGRKGAGKTALFRRLAESDGNQAIVVLAPAKLRKPWHLSADGFKDIEGKLLEKNLEWREFWAAYVAYSLFLQLKPLNNFKAELADNLGLPFHGDVTSETDLLDRLDAILSTPRSSLLVNDWLKKMDAVSAPRFLLFDGLDTGFGSAAPDRERRTRALEGLFTLYTDRGENLQNLRFKIVLREDIWKKLRFENKSHLFGRLPANSLEGLEGEVSLAREVGLLSVYEGTETEPGRYAVPDLYRIGLGMARKGQL